MEKTPSTNKDNQDREKVKFGLYLEFLDKAGIDPSDLAKAFCHLRRSFPNLSKESVAEIVTKWSRGKQGRPLTGDQVGLIKEGLRNIVEAAITLERSEGLTGVGKKFLEEIKKHCHSIARILAQGKPQNRKTALKGILKNLEGIQGLLS